MKLRNILLLGSIISVVFVLVFSGVVFLSFNKVAEENERELIANEVHTTISELTILMNEYLAKREDRPIQQWNSRYDSTLNIIDEVESEGIRTNYIELRNLFSRIVDNYESRQDSLSEVGGESIALSPFTELEERLTSQLLIKSQSIISDSSSISTEAYNNAIGAQNRANQIMLLSIILLFFVLVTTSFFTTRIILKPFHKLRDATQKVERGQFNVRANIKTGDEIEALGNSFNKMADALGKLDKEKKQIDKTKTEFQSCSFNS